MQQTIKVGWLFNNMFNLHGDRGNLLAIRAEGERRGYRVEVEQINLDTETFNPIDFDFLFCPPGEIEHFEVVAAYLEPHRKELMDYIETRPMLVTGTSVGLFGETIKRDDQSTIRGLGIIEVKTRENHVVYGDDLYYSCRYNGKEMDIIGSQIQMLDLDIKEESPFGWLKYGYGNNGETRFEGVISGKGMFTNTLGPVLVCNPWLTEEIINLIEANKNWPVWEDQRDNSLELKSLKTKIAHINKKETRLKKLGER
ncbi:type 1 glutamine amidotransferase [Acetobacterium carbinolicum]|uniref:type 1 glutamine amidotransferase n=1 Tax=Acetobacterium carbinolicum TaxID=52690 RepID=UPI0039BF7F0F